MVFSSLPAIKDIELETFKILLEVSVKMFIISCLLRKRILNN